MATKTQNANFFVIYKAKRFYIMHKMAAVQNLKTNFSRTSAKLLNGGTFGH
jgi:hypothetical protein